MKEYLNKLFKKKECISLEDLTSINELLKTNLSFKKCLELLKNNSNKNIFDKLTNELDRGYLLEDVIEKYMPKEIGKYLKNLLKTMMFIDALNLALSFLNKVKENTKAIEKAILYPFVLLFVSLSALYLFDAYGLDSILNMLKSFSSDFSSISVIRIILRIIVYVFYFSLLIFIGLLIYFIQDRNITLFYILVCKNLPNGLLQTYFCEEFISLLLICIDLGYKTRDALTILKNLHNKPIVSFLAFHLDEKLLKGESLKEASKQIYYDYTLTNFINVAVYTNDFSKILNDYVELSKNKIKTKMKKIATAVQLSSYVMIGLIVVFIYQILFLPMQAITNF